MFSGNALDILLSTKNWNKNKQTSVVIIWAKVENENAAGIPNTYDLQKFKYHSAGVLAKVLLGPVSRKARWLFGPEGKF